MQEPIKTINSKKPGLFASPAWVLLALAICAFCIGTAEFVMAGVLPNIARSFSVSIPQAGWLMTGYAVSVVVSAPLLTSLTIRMPRKYLLIGLIAFFVIGNVISAMASTYALLMMGRVISAFCHGAFFGVGSIVAAEAVAPNRRAQAIALMFTGLTLANVLGVPMGTWLAQHAGWQAMFWVIAGLGTIGMLGIMVWVPYQKHRIDANLTHELATFKHPQVWLSLLVTAMGFGGVFASFTYIAPLMTTVAGFAESHIIWLLFTFGAGLVLGNLLGGKAADRALTPAIYGALSLLALILFVFVFTSHDKLLATITLFLLGLLGFAMVSPVQTQVLKEACHAPTLASAVNIAAFNVGIAIGTYFGGLVIHLGFDYPAVNWVGGILVVLGIGAQIGITLLNARAVKNNHPHFDES